LNLNLNFEDTCTLQFNDSKFIDRPHGSTLSSVQTTMFAYLAFLLKRFLYPSLMNIPIR